LALAGVHGFGVGFRPSAHGDACSSAVVGVATEKPMAVDGGGRGVVGGDRIRWPVLGVG
jgi:hypothetical protein